jgi:hypothetical protein
MLNIDVNRSAQGVERYFDRELAVSDYLMEEPGVWAGRGAERLGLRGKVQRPQFVALLRNRNPTTGTAGFREGKKKNRATTGCAESSLVEVALIEPFALRTSPKSLEIESRDYEVES